MPSASFQANAIFVKKVWNDTFSFTDTGDWGPNYPDTDTNGYGSVNGAVAQVVAGGYYWSEDIRTPRIDYGYVQFDFYVPADAGDWSPYYWLSQGGSWPVGIEAYPGTQTTWWVGTYFRFSSDDPYYEFTAEPSTWYRMKAVFNGGPGGILAVKVWKVTDPEPDIFQAEGFFYPDSYHLSSDPLDWYPLAIEVDSPDVENGSFDNFVIGDYGEPFAPTQYRTLTARAIRRVTVERTSTADALIAPHSFHADAWIVGGRSGHSRFWDHYGTEPDTVVVLDGPIGRFPSGTDVHTVLVDIMARIVALESGWHRTMVFSADAWIRPYLRANAVFQKLDVVKNPAGADLKFPVDAEIRKGKTNQPITLDAWFIRVSARTFTASAYLIDIVC